MKIFHLFLIALLSAIVCGAQPADSTLKVDLINIVVKDIDSSVKWYQQNLGFDLIKQMDFPKRDSLKIRFLKRDQLMLELVSRKSVFSIQQLDTGYNNFYNPQLIGYNKISFRVHNIERWYRLFKSRPIQFYLDKTDDPNFGIRTFIIADRDGNLIQFVEYLNAKK